MCMFTLNCYLARGLFPCIMLINRENCQIQGNNRYNSVIRMSNYEKNQCCISCTYLDVGKWLSDPPPPPTPLHTHKPCKIQNFFNSHGKNLSTLLSNLSIHFNKYYFRSYISCIVFTTGMIWWTIHFGVFFTFINMF